VAKGVPALGYKTYFLAPAAQPEQFEPTSQIALDREKDLKEPRRPLGEDVIESRFYRLTIDKATGGVSVFDKQLGREVSKDIEIVGVQERGTNNVQREMETGRVFPLGVNETAVEENDAVRTVYKLSGSVADIPIVQRLILYQDLKRLDIENSLDWKEPRYVKVEQLFPTQPSNTQMFYGIPFGANSVKNIMPGTGPQAGDEIQRGAWEKYRMIQDWVFAGTPEWGVTVAADHQLVELEDGLIRANMIRGQRYTSVKIVRGDEVASIQYPVKGHYLFRYSFSSGPGDWKAFRSYQFGMGFNNGLVPVSVVDEISSKSLPPTHSFCSLQSDNLVISALKESETDRSIILRVYEIQGAKAETPVTFLGQQRAFRETNLLEQELSPGVQNALRVNPNEIKTIKLQAGTRGK
jgi:alpha-mannosidase